MCVGGLDYNVVILLLAVNPNYPITIAPLQTPQERPFQLLPCALSKTSTVLLFKASVRLSDALEVFFCRGSFVNFYIEGWGLSWSFSAWTTLLHIHVRTHTFIPFSCWPQRLSAAAAQLTFRLLPHAGNSVVEFTGAHILVYICHLQPRLSLHQPASFFFFLYLMLTSTVMEALAHWPSKQSWNAIWGRF